MPSKPTPRNSITMPGYTIVTNKYPAEKPMGFEYLSSDGLTDNIVYFTDQPEWNSAGHCNALLGHRLSHCNADIDGHRIVGICIGKDNPPAWLTETSDRRMCYLIRHIYEGIHGKVYCCLSTLYRTEEDAISAKSELEECSFKERHKCVHDIVKGYLAYSKLMTF